MRHTDMDITLSGNGTCASNMRYPPAALDPLKHANLGLHKNQQLLVNPVPNVGRVGHEIPEWRPFNVCTQGAADRKGHHLFITDVRLKRSVYFRLQWGH